MTSHRSSRSSGRGRDRPPGSSATPTPSRQPESPPPGPAPPRPPDPLTARKEIDMPDARTIFAAVHAHDIAAFDAMFADDGRFVFGNREPLVGREAVIAGNVAFFQLIRGLRHQLRNEW